MANAVWPAGLPQFVEAGFTERGRANVIRTPMEAGPAKMRRRYTARPRPFSVQVELTTSAQVDTFQSFVDTTLKDGSLPFDWVDPRTRAAASFRFISDADRPPYELTHQAGSIYLAKFDLEKLP